VFEELSEIGSCRERGQKGKTPASHFYVRFGKGGPGIGIGSVAGAGEGGGSGKGIGERGGGVPFVRTEMSKKMDAVEGGNEGVGGATQAIG